eukprot:m51a1_g10726 hypothetical protein (259) ;mRNA; r:270612-271530
MNEQTTTPATPSTAPGAPQARRRPRPRAPTKQQRLEQLTPRIDSEIARALRVATSALAETAATRALVQQDLSCVGGVRVLVVAQALCAVGSVDDVTAVLGFVVPDEPPARADGGAAYRAVCCGWYGGTTRGVPALRGTGKPDGWSGNTKRDDVWVNYWEGPQRQRMHAFFLPGKENVAFWTCFFEMQTTGRKRPLAELEEPEGSRAPASAALEAVQNSSNALELHHVAQYPDAPLHPGLQPLSDDVLNMAGDEFELLI